MKLLALQRYPNQALPVLLDPRHCCKHQDPKLRNRNSALQNHVGQGTKQLNRESNARDEFDEGFVGFSQYYQKEYMRDQRINDEKRDLTRKTMNNYSVLILGSAASGSFT
jgi:hypothetical protein